MKESRNNLTHGSIFSGGIDSFSYAMQSKGVKNVYAIEKNSFCRKCLNLLYPDIQIFGDINKIDYKKIPYVDVISMGFPCQNISTSGDNTGIYGKRGFELLLNSLSEIGYDAQWTCLSCQAFGFAHKRNRLFVIAYPKKDRPKSWLFRPYEVSDVQQKARTEFVLRITKKSIQSEGNYYDLCGVNGFPKNYRKIIGIIGNSINLAIANYIVDCGLNNYE